MASPSQADYFDPTYPVQLVAGAFADLAAWTVGGTTTLGQKAAAASQSVARELEQDLGEVAPAVGKTIETVALVWILGAVFVLWLTFKYGPKLLSETTKLVGVVKL
jgi:short subunit fatty acids transporter